MNENIAFKRLNEEETEVLERFINGKKLHELDFNIVDDFMHKQNKQKGLFDNCSAIVLRGVFIVQRPIGWA